MAKKQACHLVWFRNDLRVTDNKALSSACADPDAKVLAVFTATPEQWRAHHLSSRQITFLHQNLIALRDSLAKLSILCFAKQPPIFKCRTMGTGFCSTAAS